MRNRCQLCENQNLESVLSLRHSPPANAFCATVEEAISLQSYPLQVYRCNYCDHAQLGHVVDSSELFEHYVYTTGSSPALVTHFDALAKSLRPSSGSLVVEIGSNDGTLLKRVREHHSSVRVLGVDPARELAIQATVDGIETISQFFTRSLAKKIRLDRGPADVVIANNVFAHADDLSEIALAVKDLLTQNGTFIFEVQYLPDMVDGGNFDMIYHEHISYHRVKPLDNFFHGLGMQLFDVEHIPSHGGSIRCFVTGVDNNKPETNRKLDLLCREANNRINWGDFYKKIKHATLKMQWALVDLRARGRKLIGYGAPAKMTTLCHQFGLSASDIVCVVDDNPRKQGKFCPGTGIPVVSEIGVDTTDVVIFAWNYADGIAKKIRNLGFTGDIWSPMPQMRKI